MNRLKVGDKIRFLNASGGGIVRRIQGNVAWVEGEDGFELPTPLSECVPVEEGDSFIPGYHKPQAPISSTPLKPKEKKNNIEEEKYFDAETSHIEKKIPMPHLLIPERPDGDNISIYLAWLPVEMDKFGDSPLECYLINDSNYTLSFQLWSAGGDDKYEILSEGELERDTKLFIEELPMTQVASRENLRLAYIPFKRERLFTPKPAQTLQVALNPIRLLKKYAYTVNDFFEDKALIVPLLEQDQPYKEKVLSTEELQILADSLQTPQKDLLIEKEKKKLRQQRGQRQEAKLQKDLPLEIDLHIEQLIDNTTGLTPSDMLSLQLTEFKKVMNDAIHNRGQKIVFIHGKGEGVLRKAILDELKKHYPQTTAQDASFKEYGFGATMVTIHK